MIKTINARQALEKIASMRQALENIVEKFALSKDDRMTRLEHEVLKIARDELSKDWNR